MKLIRIFFQILFLTFLLLTVFNFIFNKFIFYSLGGGSLQIQLSLTYSSLYLFILLRVFKSFDKFNDYYWFKFSDNTNDIKIIYNYFSYLFVVISIVNVFITFLFSQETWVNFKLFSITPLYILTTIICVYSINKNKLKNTVKF